MNNRIFVISDTHFGQSKVIEFEAANRPFSSIEEHDEEIVRRWNNVVSNKDTVWHLGDVLFGRESFATLGRLNGIKKLVMGNHDQYPCSDYLRYFSKVVGVAVLRGCVLTHVPVHPAQFNRYRANIHGHLHSSTVNDKLFAHKYINVSCERIGLAPVLLDKVLQDAGLSVR